MKYHHSVILIYIHFLLEFVHSIWSDCKYVYSSRSVYCHDFYHGSCCPASYLRSNQLVFWKHEILKIWLLAHLKLLLPIVLKLLLWGEIWEILCQWKVGEKGNTIVCPSNFLDYLKKLIWVKCLSKKKKKHLNIIWPTCNFLVSYKMQVFSFRKEPLYVFSSSPYFLSQYKYKKQVRNLCIYSRPGDRVWLSIGQYQVCIN